ncbi:hypothetical protein MKX08_003384 [Trichoderma sp. CBMAI-0020]|nr:hypothetical protein MKX08_003384 [Trichoderma sp. CBMAI-0020]
MANQTPCYYFAPTWDFPPNGPLQLGNVLMSVKRPEQALYTAPLPNASEIITSKKSQVDFSREKLKAGKFSIFTRFIRFIGLGIDIATSWDTANEEAFTFERLETTFFIPTQPWLEKCLANSSVQRYLEKCRYRKPVYIITGLKTVTGAAVKTNKRSASATTTGIEVAIPGGEVVLPSANPEIFTKKAARDKMSWEDHSDFIFAYRVSKVWVKKGSILEEDYTKGAMFEREEKTVVKIALEIARVEEADPAEEGFLTEEMIDGDEKIMIALPEGV